ncbi:OsmC family protein [Antarcticibacterium flavum]|uniref:OsmC family protein n=1 Tax=Antarcticibacterium flavum TaxID=2058175 RepID=A0A5B7X2G5_9FLAO|nr:MULTISPECIES: OsmC family protein [Antarcticibacterium]MCM4159904.1 osmotically inducible protein OsmC [Antarcticibacterium sp. W02-3]QCY68902.1 OsmC family protein [Antarcticibacterium flavum]
MKIHLKRLNDNYHFETKNERGDIVQLDNKSEPNPQGASPMELLLMGIAGCSSIDIVMILKKQKIELEDLQVEVEGFRQDGAVPNVFTAIKMDVYLKGDFSADKAKRAVDLSIDKYCSVAKMLEKTAEISYDVYLNGELIN